MEDASAGAGAGWASLVGLGGSLSVTGLCLSEGLMRAGGVAGNGRNLVELLQ